MAIYKPQFFWVNLEYLHKLSQYSYVVYTYSHKYVKLSFYRRQEIGTKHNNIIFAIISNLYMVSVYRFLYYRYTRHSSLYRKEEIRLLTTVLRAEYCTHTQL